VKFTCPGCGSNVWGKPDTEVGCKPCGYLDMLPERPAVQSPQAN
jgi:ribosomal protein S27E